MLSKSNMYEQCMTGVLGDGDFSTIICKNSFQCARRREGEEYCAARERGCTKLRKIEGKDGKIKGGRE